MTTTARKYTPAQVSALSDRDLSEAVAREVFGARRVSDSQHVLKDGEFLSRAYGAFVKVSGSTILLDAETEAGLNSVLKHMRQRWAQAAPDPVRQLDWYICGWGDYWCVGTHHCGASGSEFPLHDATLRKGADKGRCIFEAALLASQDL